MWWINNSLRVLHAYSICRLSHLWFTRISLVKASRYGQIVPSFNSNCRFGLHTNTKQWCIISSVWIVCNYSFKPIMPHPQNAQKFGKEIHKNLWNRRVCLLWIIFHWSRDLSAPRLVSNVDMPSSKQCCEISCYWSHSIRLDFTLQILFHLEVKSTRDYWTKTEKDQL